MSVALGQELPGHSSPSAAPGAWFPSHSAHSSAGAHQCWALHAVNLRHCQQQLSMPALYQFELGLEVSCKQWGYLHHQI